MGRAALFTTLIVLGLLVSRPSFAQFEHAYSATPPAEVPRPTAPEPVYPEHPRSTPVPQGYHLESHVRLAPMVTGSILAGISYSLAVLISFSGCRGDRWLLLPVAGPIAGAVAATSHARDGAGCDDPEGLLGGLKVFSALGQGVGGWLILYSVERRRTYLVPNGATSDAHADSRRSLAIVPALAPSTASIVVLGTF